MLQKIHSCLHSVERSLYDQLQSHTQCPADGSGTQPQTPHWLLREPVFTGGYPASEAKDVPAGKFDNQGAEQISKKFGCLSTKYSPSGKWSRCDSPHLSGVVTNRRIFSHLLPLPRAVHTGSTGTECLESFTFTIHTRRPKDRQRMPAQAETEGMHPSGQGPVQACVFTICSAAKEGAPPSPGGDPPQHWTGGERICAQNKALNIDRHEVGILLL